MDRKSLLILVGCFVLMMLWMPLVNLIYPPRPAPRNTNLVASLTGTNTLGGHGTNIAGTNAPGAERPAPPQITAPRTAPTPWTAPEEPERTEVLENSEGRYVFTSHGGGLKYLELKAYPETVGLRKRAAAAASGRFAALNQGAPLPAFSLIGGGPFAAPASFRLTRTETGLRAEQSLSNGLHVVKDVRLSTNHLMSVTVTVENPTAQPLGLPQQELVVGTATPINLLDSGRFLGVQWFDGARAEYRDDTWFANRTLGCLPGTPRAEFQSAGTSNVVWAAVHNQFFTMILAPKENAPQFIARRIDLPGPTAADLAATPKAVTKPFGIQAMLVYPAQVLAPGQALERVYEVYTGPKEYNTLAKLSKSQDQAMNFSSFFGWFAKALLLSMIALHGLGLPYGLAIIVITVIIKLLFWPLTAASTRSMKRMQALQPQMKAIQEKYKDDPKKAQVKLMEFMKQNKVSPLGGCLPMALQIPVFIGFYQMLQSAIELRGASFLWARDLSQPDTVAVLFGFPVNPLPLIMGATQFWQARLTPASPGVDPVQQKIMQYMPLIFIFILYNFPAGLALYWTVQNLLSILQMRLTKVSAGPAATGTAPARPAVARRA